MRCRSCASGFTAALCLTVLALCTARVFATEKSPETDSPQAKSEKSGKGGPGGLIAELRAETRDRIAAAKEAGSVIELTQSSFEKGTVRIKKPGVYRLKENISFNPNRGDEMDWLPVCDKSSKRFQKEYCDAERGGPSKPYRLGFFAAVTIESSGVVLDLNGKVLEQSKEHALQQRFFANIELAEQPFIHPKKGTAQGPAPDGFGKIGEIVAARDSAVINGIVGLSSHHGIHGNNASRVLIDGVTFREYEVAAVHVNGADSLAVVDCVAEGHREDVPVRGTYSGGRFLLQALKPLLKMRNGKRGLSKKAYDDISGKIEKLEKAMRQARDEILKTGQLVDKELDRQFGLPVTKDGRRVVDGNSYGMAFSTAGVIVEAWKVALDKDSKFGRLSNLVLDNVRISETAANVHEVPTLSVAGESGDKGSHTQTDSAGSAVRIEEILEKDGETYKPDLLHDLRFAVAWWASAKHGNDEYLVKAVKAKRLGTWKIDGALGAWARNGGKISDVIRENRFIWMCNQDTMAHRQKGVVGLLIQGADGAKVSGVKVEKTVNYGLPGTSKRCGAYAFEAPDLKAARLKGYNGCETRGILAVASHGVSITDTKVSETNSRHGSATGLQMFNDMRDVSLHGVKIMKTSVSDLDSDGLPNSPRYARGLIVDDTDGLESKKVTVLQ